MSYSIYESAITINLNSKNISLGIDSAVICGLIINELISNSFKHAFPDGKGGDVYVSLQLIDKEVELVVRDNGKGIPQNMDISHPSTLGLRMVTSLIKNQLKGKMEIKREKGTEVKIRFGDSGKK